MKYDPDDVQMFHPMGGIMENWDVRRTQAEVNIILDSPTRKIKSVVMTATISLSSLLFTLYISLYRCSTVPHVDLLTMDKSVALSEFFNML